ncbi:hypothetical protein [Dokdonia sp. R86516]|uniref:hypothetical protein n=1 Tax=Dokdonia sp. R86516 TaxID=3093856 RepID=UPI0037C869C3
MKNRIHIILFSMAGILLLSSAAPMELNKGNSDLKIQLNEVATYNPMRETKNLEVSEAAVAWHMDHIYLMVNQLYKALEQSNESDYKTKFNMKRAYVFTFNRMPRGKATAPEAARPKDNIDLNTIQMHYEQALATVDKLSNLPEKKHFNHPVLGTLNRDKTIKFLAIHTEHHLKIIRDILEDK